MLGYRTPDPTSAEVTSVDLIALDLISYTMCLWEGTKQQSR